MLTGEKKRIADKKYYHSHKEEAKKQKRAYYLKNQDAIKERVNKHRLEHLEEIREKKRQYRLKNREKILEKKKKYYRENKKEISVRQKKFRLENKEKIRESKRRYELENKEKINEYRRKYRATYPELKLALDIKHLTKLGFPFKLEPHAYHYALSSWSKTVRKLGHGLCQICPNPATISHHIIHKAKYPGLSLNINNGIPLCVTCHSEVHGYSNHSDQ